jgi:hypothetical protein
VRGSKPAKIKKLVGLHVRIPEELLDELIVQRDAMRKTSSLANLSDVVRVMLEEGVRKKR